MLKQEEQGEMAWNGGGEDSDGGELMYGCLSAESRPPRRSPASIQSVDGDCAATEASKAAACGAGTTCTSAFGRLGTCDELDSVSHRHVGGVTDESLHHFFDAMSLVDSDKKEGWTRAQASCSPAVLQHECCPCYFLLACQFNPWDAANRMCAYWEERIRLFEGRAFEPMTLGTEAVPPTGLTREDVKVLERGPVQVLPKDRKGRSVIFADDGKLEPYMLNQTNSRLRVLWYMHHANFTSGGDNAHRLVTLYACYRPPSGGQYGSAIWQYSTGAVRFQNLLPIVIESIHLLTLQTKTGTLIHVIMAATAAMVGNYLSSLTKVHRGTAKRGAYANPLEEDAHSKATLLQKLIDEGFARRGLPDWAGGSFGVQEFRSWATRRRRFEQRAFWTLEQRAQHRREMNRVHSRKKRRRRHEELSDLQDQVAFLEAENARARGVQAHLENLILAAREAVASSHVPPTPGMAGLVPANNWFYDFTSLPTPCVEPYQLSVLASLEPDPIAPSAIPSARPSAGALEKLFHAPLQPLSLCGEAQREADQRNRFLECDGGYALRESKRLYGSSYRPVLIQQESYASSSSAFQNSLSSAGESAATFPAVFGLGPMRSEPDGTIDLQGNAVAPLLHGENSSFPLVSSSLGATDVHQWEQPSDLAGAQPSGTRHTAASLLRAMFHQQPQFFANMSSDFSQGLDYNTPTNDADVARISHRLRCSPLPTPFPDPSPAGMGAGEHGWAATHAHSASGVSHSCRRRSRDGDYDGDDDDDGRVDASTLFDLDWPEDGQNGFATFF